MSDTDAPVKRGRKTTQAQPEAVPKNEDVIQLPLSELCTISRITLSRYGMTKPCRNRREHQAVRRSPFHYRPSA